MADGQTTDNQDQGQATPDLVPGSFRPLSSAAASSAPAPVGNANAPELVQGTFRPLTNLHPNVEKQATEEDEGWLHKMFLGDETAAGAKLPEGFYDVHPSSQFHVIQGSPLEKMIKFFDPTFQGGVTKEQHGINESKDALNLPLANVSQFIDKDQHPIGKAVAEAAQSLTSPGNLAIMVSTGGLGLVNSAKALGMANRLISAGFSGAAIAQAYKHFGDFKDAYDKGDANEAMYQLTHLLLSGAMATAAGEHFVTGEAPASITGIDEAVGKAVSGTAKSVANTARAFGFGQSLEDLVTKVSPPSKGKASRYQESVKGALPQLKEIFKANPDVSTPQEMVDSIQKHIDTIEDNLRDQARKLQTPEGEPAEKSILYEAEGAVSLALDDYFKEHVGAYKQPVIDAAKAEVIDRLRQGTDVEPRSPSLFEAENLRRQWNKETTPAFGSDTSIPNAARDAKIVANSVLKNLVDEKYTDLGVKGVGEWRRQEAPLIDVKDQLAKAFKKSQEMGDWSLINAATKSMGWGLIGSLFGHVPGGLAGEGLGIAKDYIRDRLTNPNRLIQRAADVAARQEGPTGAVTPKEISPSEPLPKYPGKKGAIGPEIPAVVPKSATPESAQEAVESAGGVYRGKNSHGLVEVTLPRTMTDKLEGMPDKFKDFVSVTLPEDKVTPDAVKEAMNRKFQEMGGKAEVVPEVVGKTTPNLLERRPENARIQGDVRSDIHHEMGHAIVGNEYGVKTADGIYSDRHPTSLENKNVAATKMDWGDLPSLMEPEKFAPHLERVLTTLMGGGAAEEVLHGLPMEENMGMSGDDVNAQIILAALGYSGEEASSILDAAKDRAREILKRPGVADKMRDYSAEREEGLADTHHMSQGRLEQLLKEIKDGQTNRNASRGGGEAKTANIENVRGAKGGNQGGTEQEVQQIAAKKEAKLAIDKKKLLAGGAAAAGLGALGTLMAPKAKEQEKEKEATPQMMEGTFRPLPASESEPAAEVDIPSTIDQAAEDYNIPLPLFRRQAEQESGLDPAAISPKGAIGVLQLMPRTARELDVDPYDPQQNIRGGAAYMSKLYMRFGNWTQALAAYNAGPERVEQAVSEFGYDWLSYMPKETQNYVKSILKHQEK